MHFVLPYIDEPLVFMFLSALGVSKSTGLDGIDPRLLKLASVVITKSITYVAKKCILRGNFPVSSKRARVNPLHEGGAKDYINNYRPVYSASFIKTAREIYSN